MHVYTSIYYSFKSYLFTRGKSLGKHKSLESKSVLIKAVTMCTSTSTPRLPKKIIGIVLEAEMDLLECWRKRETGGYALTTCAHGAALRVFAVPSKRAVCLW
ncbi:hypothetical protein M758_4G024400 [Ceratodon purpureus]|uniref:Uncharacterized protein n=1 Tax=Ceratodon purpureus TaxID=3225 RepID=A0A8T0I5V2_CERPU|nr:hypothetical protein KC19_4G027300 [Ceratodon purpureus]KAG0617915.1 hypothetical protein M758_4G024400 [Ceratodon purpureus]